MTPSDRNFAWANRLQEPFAHRSSVLALFSPQRLTSRKVTSRQVEGLAWTAAMCRTGLSGHRLAGRRETAPPRPTAKYKVSSFTWLARFGLARLGYVSYSSSWPCHETQAVTSDSRCRTSSRWHITEVNLKYKVRPRCSDSSSFYSAVQPDCEETSQSWASSTCFQL